MMTSTPAPTAKPVQDDFYHHLFRPFLLAEAAAALLGFSAKHVVRLAENRELRGFNLAVKTEGADLAMSDRTPDRMLRIQARSVERMRRPELFRGVRLADLRLEDDLLHRRASFSIWEITYTFDCSDDHVRRLQAAGQLTGPALSTVSDRQHIARASLLAFLTAREL